MTKKLTTDEFITKSKLAHHPTEYDYTNVSYTNGNTKIHIKCNDHGEFIQRAGNHIRGIGCPKCANEQRNKDSKKQHSVALAEICDRNTQYPPVFFDNDVYRTAVHDINWMCEFGHQWKSKFGRIKSGGGCPVCAISLREQTNLERYGVKYATQKHMSDDVLNKLNDVEYLRTEHTGGKTLEAMAMELGVTAKAVSSKFDKFGLDKLTFPNSQPERDIHTFLKSINIEFEANTKKVIPPQELDIYIPNKNIAIEYNGIRWHSELQGRGKKYHINKTIACKAIGMQLVHISDIEWIQKPNITRSMLRNRLIGSDHIIYGRKCTVVSLSSNEAKEFLDANHIQGNRHSSIRFGLTFDDALVSILTISKPRYSSKHQHEIYRFCNKLDTSVIGGASKLFKHFISEHNPTNVITYADRRFGEGLLYNKMGFTFKHNSDPNYHYFKHGQPRLQSRVRFQKHKLSKLLETFDPSLTEWQNMVNDGYDRIWDCGNAVWEWTR